MARTLALQTRSLSKSLVICGILLGLSLGLGACDRADKIGSVADQRGGEAQQALLSASEVVKGPGAVKYDPLTVSNKVWSGSRARRLHRGMPLPTRFEDVRGVTLVSSENMSLNDISSAITSQTGIPVRLASMNIPGRAASASNASLGGGASGSSGTEMSVSYEGPLSGLLDRISAHFGVSWRYDGSSISITKYETRVFSVEALPGTREINEGLQDDVSTSGSSSSGGSTTQNTLTQNSKTTIALKYWEELGTVLNSMVGAQGAVVVSPTMGTVTITTTPETMATVADYLAKENKRLARQIAINVRIYSVDLKDGQDFSVAFNAFLKKMDLSYTSLGGPTNANSSLITDPIGGGSLSVAILNKAGHREGYATEMLQALSYIGKTSQIAQFPLTTLNNHPVSRRVGTDQAYVSSINSVTSTGTSTTTTYTPVISTIHDGFSLQLTPRLLDDGRILLQYSLSLIGLESLDSQTFDTTSITLPKTDNRIFVQQSMLKSGQTLVIGGVDQEKMFQNKQGVGTPENFLLGGGVSGFSDHLMMFIAITPQVLDVAADEEPS